MTESTSRDDLLDADLVSRIEAADWLDGLIMEALEKALTGYMGGKGRAVAVDDMSGHLRLISEVASGDRRAITVSTVVELDDIIRDGAGWVGRLAAIVDEHLATGVVW